MGSEAIERPWVRPWLPLRLERHPALRPGSLRDPPRAQRATAAVLCLRRRRRRPVLRHLRQLLPADPPPATRNPPHLPLQLPDLHSHPWPHRHRGLRPLASALDDHPLRRAHAARYGSGPSPAAPDATKPASIARRLCATSIFKLIRLRPARASASGRSAPSEHIQQSGQPPCRP